jgi:hypothetical protein
VSRRTALSKSSHNKLTPAKEHQQQKEHGCYWKRQ